MLQFRTVTARASAKGIVMTPTERAMEALYDRVTDKVTFEYLASASPRELMEFINCFHPNQNSHWFHKAKVILDVRLAEDAAKAADKLIQHTEQLTKQTDTHIQHTETLTRQTDKLVTESVNLSKLTHILIWLTVALGLFAAIQIVLMVFDIWKHK